MSKAREMAETIVKGFVEQDRKKYPATEECFMSIFGELFYPLEKSHIGLAAKHYTIALEKQDKITELEPGANEKLKHLGWEDVREELVGVCEALNLPVAYAEETNEFWRLHSIERDNGRYGWSPNNGWVRHCLSADMHFTTAILGTDEFARMLGPLYVAAVGCHDMRSESGKLHTDAVFRGRDIMEQYYAIILKNAPKR